MQGEGNHKGRRSRRTSGKGCREEGTAPSSRECPRQAAARGGETASITHRPGGRPLPSDEGLAARAGEENLQAGLQYQAASAARGGAVRSVAALPARRRQSRGRGVGWNMRPVEPHNRVAGAVPVRSNGNCRATIQSRTRAEPRG